MGQFGSAQDSPDGFCSDIWLSHVSWPDEALARQTALFRPPTPQDGPWLGRSYSSLLRSQHLRHRTGGSVTELETRRELVNNEDEVFCKGCGSWWWFSTCSHRRPALQDTLGANAPLDTPSPEGNRSALGLFPHFSIAFIICHVLGQWLAENENRPKQGAVIRARTTDRPGIPSCKSIWGRH